MGFKIEKEDRKIRRFKLDKRAQSQGLIKHTYARLTQTQKPLAQKRSGQLLARPAYGL